MFDTTIALLKARIAWLKKEKSPAALILEPAMDDIKGWANELQMTEDDEV